MRVAEAFRVYWLEAESDAEFRRANWRARSALHRYALRLMEKRQRKVEA
jgi:allophanate hydrolase subunit 2